MYNILEDCIGEAITSSQKIFLNGDKKMKNTKEINILSLLHALFTKEHKMGNETEKSQSRKINPFTKSLNIISWPNNNTLCDSTDGTGENYAKQNKPGSKGQIPYDLTFNWNIINKRKKQTKYNQRR